MIILVCVKLNNIFKHGRNFNWIKPQRCPRCNSVRVWGHGFILAYFDGFAQGLLLRRYRCPDCKCIIRMKPKGYFPRFQTPIHIIRCCLKRRLTSGKWPGRGSKSRQRHWLWALKRNAFVFFGLNQDLMAAFDQLQQKGQIPVSRAV